MKGFAKCPGFDYNNTFLPVVQFKTIHAMIAIAVEKGLLMEHMKVKGAYLNETLKETVYMFQPKGFDDETNWICHLKKAIYGLKQSC